MSDARPSLEELAAMDLEQIDFETALDLLDQTVSRLEEGDLPLDASIALYEQGLRLSEHCAQVLAAAELRVQEIGASEVG